MGRLVLALVLLALPGMGWAQGFVRVEKQLNAVGPCTATSCTFTAPILLPVGTAAAPSLAFASETGLGIYRGAASAISFGYASGNRVSIYNGGLILELANNYSLGWSSTSDALGTPDQFIYRGSFQGARSKSLTDAAAAVAYATIAVPTNSQIAGEMIWTATSSAAAVRFVANGSIRFWGADEGGTPVCGINAIGTAGEGHSSGANTLVCTWTNVVSTTNCVISVTCTNNTAGVDPITVNGRFDMPTTATITFN